MVGNRAIVTFLNRFYSLFFGLGWVSRPHLLAQMVYSAAEASRAVIILEVVLLISVEASSLGVS